MDGALDYGSSGWEFDSLRAHFPRPPFFGGRGRFRLVVFGWSFSTQERCLVNEADSSINILKLCAAVADSLPWDSFVLAPWLAA